MAQAEIRGEPDDALIQIRDALNRYLEHHPGAQAAVRRYGRRSIHIRIIDPGFASVERFDRHDLIWPYLDPLPDDVVGYVTSILPLAPEEVADSWGNKRFEDMIPARA